MELPLWFPMPPVVQHGRVISQPGGLRELVGDTVFNEHQPTLAMAEETKPEGRKRGTRQAFVGDPFSGSVLGAGTGDENDEKGMM